MIPLGGMYTYPLWVLTVFGKCSWKIANCPSRAVKTMAMTKYSRRLLHICICVSGGSALSLPHRPSLSLSPATSLQLCISMQVMGEG